MAANEIEQRLTIFVLAVTKIVEPLNWRWQELTPAMNGQRRDKLGLLHGLEEKEPEAPSTWRGRLARSP
jgi:hypothetical protein